MDKFDIFDINYTNPEDGDLYGISIVDDAANGKFFIAMNEQKPKFEIKLADAKKKLLVGVALIPEQLIYRNFDGKECYIKFSAEVIERLSQDFLIKGYQKNSTYNHTGKFLEGISLVESWLIEDPSNDKSVALGFTDLPKGTWMVTMKLNDKLWAEYIESGKAKGFSIDSYLDLKKIIMKNKKQLEMKKNNKGLFAKMVNLFKTENMLAEITIPEMGVLTAEEFELGFMVYKNVEGVEEPLMSSSFEHEGYKFVTDETGTIIEKTEMESTEEPVVEEEVVVEVEMEEVAPEVQEEVITVVEDIVEEVTSTDVEEIDVEALKSKIAELEAQLEIITKEKETITSENVSMKSQLASIPNSSKLRTNLSKNEVPTRETEMDRLRAILAKK